jgi:Ricin-type beta-trefoil lectin domain-like
MKTLPFLSVLSAAITTSMLCLAQPPTTCNQAALFEAFEGEGFTGGCFGSPQVPAPMPFKPRSLKIQTNSLLEFRVDNGISDNPGALISRGPVSVPNLSALPRRARDGAGNVGPAGNFDGVIVSVRAGFLPPGGCPGDNATVFTVIGCSAPPHRLSDADCQTSDSPPRNQAVYRIQLSSESNTCLAFNPDDVTQVPLNNCGQEQKKDFTLIQAPNKCWVIRNGNTAVPPAGRCLFVDHEDTGNPDDNTDEVGAAICANTDQERWKLVLRDGKFNLINQRSGKCLSRGGDDARAFGCDGILDSTQLWNLVFVRPQ